MALVAYASSDSGCSDEEDDNETAISTQRQSIQVVTKTGPLNVNHPTATATVDHGGVNSADLTGDSHISDEEDIYPLTATTGGQGWSLPAPKHSAPSGNAPGPEIVLAGDAGQAGLLLTGADENNNIL